jgi:secreted trypsin-like serine protease
LGRDGRGNVASVTTFRARTIPVLLIALAATTLAAALVPSAGAEVTVQVTNGTIVDRARFDEQWRSVVSIRPHAIAGARGGHRDKSRHTCGGTLVRPDIVVTAAHCMATNFGAEGVGRGTVLVGTRRLAASTDSYGESIPIADVMIHPRFANSFLGLGSLAFDVAVIKLVRPATRGATMPLIAADEDALWGGGNGLSGDRAIVAGWGVRGTELPSESFPMRTAAAQGSIGGSLAARVGAFVDAWTDSAPGNGGFDEDAWTTQAELREVGIPLLPDRLCASTDSSMKQSAATFEPETMLCGGTPDTVKGIDSDREGACMGDSGGPLVVDAADGTPRLVGIVSWGPSEQGPCNRASVFTRVDGVRTWIGDAIAELDTTPTVVMPTSVTSTNVGRSAIRVSWSDVVGAHSSVRLVREIRLVDLLPPGLSIDQLVEDDSQLADLTSYSMRMEVARGGFGTSALNVKGVLPRAANSDRVDRFRLEARLPSGRLVQSQELRVTPRTDRRAPSRPRRPKRVAVHQGAVVLGWSTVRDDECVNGYLLELRPTSGTNRSWIPHSFVATGQCEPLQMWESAPTRFNSPTRRTLFDVKRGTYLARVVAVDLAGNRAVSPTTRVVVPRMVKDLGLVAGAAGGSSTSPPG